jgi:hypothetical protein
MVEKLTIHSLERGLVDIPVVSMPVARSLKTSDFCGIVKKLHILKRPITPSTRCTCVMIMQFSWIIVKNTLHVAFIPETSPCHLDQTKRQKWHQQGITLETVVSMAMVRVVWTLRVRQTCLSAVFTSYMGDKGRNKMSVTV